MDALSRLNKDLVDARNYKLKLVALYVGKQMYNELMNAGEIQEDYDVTLDLKNEHVRGIPLFKLIGTGHAYHYRMIGEDLEPPVAKTLPSLDAGTAAIPKPDAAAITAREIQEMQMALDAACEAVISPPIVSSSNRPTIKAYSDDAIASLLMDTYVKKPADIKKPGD
jgi:hypothetical protein